MDLEGTVAEIYASSIGEGLLFATYACYSLGIKLFVLAYCLIALCNLLWTYLVCCRCISVLNKKADGTFLEEYNSHLRKQLGYIPKRKKFVVKITNEGKSITHPEIEKIIQEIPDINPEFDDKRNDSKIIETNRLDLEFEKYMKKVTLREAELEYTWFGPSSWMPINFARWFSSILIIYYTVSSGTTGYFSSKNMFGMAMFVIPPIIVSIFGTNKKFKNLLYVLNLCITAVVVLLSVYCYTFLRQGINLEKKNFSGSEFVFALPLLSFNNFWQVPEIFTKMEKKSFSLAFKKFLAADLLILITYLVTGILTSAALDDNNQDIYFNLTRIVTENLGVDSNGNSTLPCEIAVFLKYLFEVLLISHGLIFIPQIISYLDREPWEPITIVRHIYV